MDKSTATLSATVIDLDDPKTGKPLPPIRPLFVRGSSPVCIDEYQHVSEVLADIKAERHASLIMGRKTSSSGRRRMMKKSADEPSPRG